MKEKNIQSKIQLCHPPHARIFRNNVGQGWQGKSIQVTSESQIAKIRSAMNAGARVVALINPRPLNAGLCKGSSDLIGWTSVEVDESMIGQKLAVFTAIEVKTPKGRATEQQSNFIGAILEAGGKAGIARSEQDALDIWG